MQSYEGSVGNIQSINLSIAPTYLCNMDCSFCYLSRDQRRSKAFANLVGLSDVLGYIRQHRTIEHIDLYGGEIALLPEDYLNELVDLAKSHMGANGVVNVITNYLKVNPVLLRPDIDLSVSFDFKGREKYEQVYNNLVHSSKPFSVLMLASPEMLETPIDLVVSAFNNLKRLRSVEVKPYSANQFNQHTVPDQEFEEFIIKLYEHPRRSFKLVNADWAYDCISDNYNAYSDNHLYITPENKLAVLDFDVEDKEYFRVMETFEDYLQWSADEKTKVQSLPHCSSCPWLGKCMTEHYKTSCSGYPNLLNYFSN